MSRRLLPCALALSTFAGVCDPGEAFVVVAEVDEQFSFETGLDGWSPAASGAEAPASWTAERASDAASDGSYALRLDLDNVNGMGMVWLERPFTVTPEEEYTVDIRFMLGTADWGDVNHWRVLAGVHDRAPSSTGEVSPSGDTGNGSATDVGLTWVDKRLSYSFETAEEQSSAWVALGVWGTWETARTYYIDDVQIVFTRR